MHTLTYIHELTAIL